MAGDRVLDPAATEQTEDIMADDTNGAAPAETAAPPKLQVLTQYVRDLSFENIAAQKGLGSDGKPDVRVTVNIDAQAKQSDRYEVALKVKIDSKLADKPIFILELDYAGLFLIQNVPPEQMTALLMIECPRQIFPYVRRIVGDVTRDGGYPPLNLEQIDFLALYRSEIARRQAEAAKPPAQA
jgi:preprotein translocase subunit SecB